MSEQEPEPVAGDVSPATDAAPGPRRRRVGPADLVAPIVAATAVTALLAVIAFGIGPEGMTTPGWIGLAVGLVIGIPIALAARRILQQRTGRRLADPMLLVPVIVLAGAAALSLGLTIRQHPGSDPASWASIADPYTLSVPPTDDPEAKFMAGLNGTVDYALRQVDGTHGAIGYLLVIANGAPDGTVPDGMSSTGNTSSPTTIGDVAARLVTGAKGVALTWQAHGMLTQVISLDEPTARALAEAVIAARGADGP